ncbi:hypothetical protein D3C86_2011310 [compost metagenome]
MEPPIAQNAADDRANDEADAEHGVEQAEALGALILGGDVGDVGRCDCHVGAGDAGNGAADNQHPEMWREGHDEIVDGGTGQGHQQDGTPPEAIA